MNKHIGEEGKFPASPFPLTREKLFSIFFCAFDKFYETANVELSNLQPQMRFYRLLYLLRLDTYVPLCDRSAAVL